ncbi:MAG: ankyrin repeat domain-containing protein [Isosphaeraceae bacterium]
MVEAVVCESLGRIIALLDDGVDINARNERGETAFSFACANNALSAATLLHSRGADINTVDAGCGSPLDWAVCWSSPEFRAWLVSVGGKRQDTSYDPWPWPRQDEDGTCNHRPTSDRNRGSLDTTRNS